MSDFTNTGKARIKRNTTRKQSEGKKVIDVEEVSPANEKDGRESCRVSETQREHSEGMSACADKDKIEKTKNTARKQSRGKKVIDEEDTSTNEKDGRESCRVSETQKEHSEGMSNYIDTRKNRKKRNTARKQ